MTSYFKAVSLWQPWASLCVIPHPADAGRSVKGFETRSWATSYRGPLLIHAALRFTRDERDFCYLEPIRSQLRRFYSAADDLPRGALIGRVHLVDCIPTWSLRGHIDRFAEAMGNYDDGRFGWEIMHPVMFEEPIPYRGQQQLFDVPASILPPGSLPPSGGAADAR